MPERDPSRPRGRKCAPAEIAAARLRRSVARGRTEVRVEAVRPPQQRAVRVQRYYEEVPDQEIAEILGIARVTVRSHALHALTRLRRVLTVDGDA